MPRLLWIGLIIVTGLIALIRVFPLSWAASALPEQIGTFSGTVWNGQVRQLPLIGELSIKGSVGGIKIESPPGDITLRGTLSPGAVEDFVLSMPVARIPATNGQLQDLDGRVSLRIEAAAFSNETCKRASGTVSTDVLVANRRQFQWVGPALSGPLDCIDGRARMRLSGSEAGQTVEITVISGFDGRYETQISVQTNDMNAANVLALYGFTMAEAGLYTLNEQGRWR